MQVGDKLKIDWGGKIYNARIAGGLDNMMKEGSDTIKVIIEPDSSYNPTTINKSCVIEINGESV